MYCNACGCQVSPTARFCPQCGRALPQTAGAGRRRALERPREGRKIAGVCLALANHFDLDVTVVRVLWVVLTILFGVLVFGVVAYIVAWILIPEEPLPLVAMHAHPNGTVSGPGAPSA